MSSELGIEFNASSPLRVDEDVGVVSIAVSVTDPANINIAVGIALNTSGTATQGEENCGCSSMCVVKQHFAVTSLRTAHSFVANPANLNLVIHSSCRR